MRLFPSLGFGVASRYVGIRSKALTSQEIAYLNTYAQHSETYNPIHNHTFMVVCFCACK